MTLIKKTEVISSFVSIRVYFKSYIKFLLLSTKTGTKLQGAFDWTQKKYQVTRRTMYRMRALSMFTSLHPLRHGRCLTHMFPSCTFKEFRNLSHTSWSSPKIPNQREPRKIGFIALPRSPKEIEINRKFWNKNKASQYKR